MEKMHATLLELLKIYHATSGQINAINTFFIPVDYPDCTKHLYLLSTYLNTPFPQPFHLFAPTAMVENPPTT